MGLSLWFEQTIPSGVAAAAIGAPALLWLIRVPLTASDHIHLALPSKRSHLSGTWIIGVGLLCLVGILLSLLTTHSDMGFSLALPGNFQWQLRWPRILSALALGTALPVAGTILQRMVNNPLASPDMLGVSSGATFAMITSGIMAGSSLTAFNWGVAFMGSLSVLIALLVLAKRSNFNPSAFILSGIALTALLEALVQFALAQGFGDSYTILLWLTGSTYRVTSDKALVLTGIVILLLIGVLALSRWLTLITIGRAFTRARGLNPEQANTLMLIIVALLCASATATVGPVAFIGLVAPHMATLSGAQRIKAQLIMGSLIGATLMIWADFIGQILIYPHQISAGTLVAILGSGYFLFLMMKNRL